MSLENTAEGASDLRHLTEQPYLALFTFNTNEGLARSCDYNFYQR